MKNTNDIIIEYLKEIDGALAEVEFCMDEKGEYLPESIKAKIAPHLKAILDMQKVFEQLLIEMDAEEAE